MTEIRKQIAKAVIAGKLDGKTAVIADNFRKAYEKETDGRSKNYIRRQINKLCEGKPCDMDFYNRICK